MNNNTYKVNTAEIFVTISGGGQPLPLMLSPETAERLSDELRAAAATARTTRAERLRSALSEFLNSVADLLRAAPEISDLRLTDNGCNLVYAGQPCRLRAFPTINWLELFAADKILKQWALAQFVLPLPGQRNGAEQLAAAVLAVLQEAHLAEKRDNPAYKPGHLAQIAAGALAAPPTLETTAAVLTALVTAIEEVLPGWQPWPRYMDLAKTLLRRLADSTWISELSETDRTCLVVKLGLKLVDQARDELLGTGRYPELWPAVIDLLRLAQSVPDLPANVQCQYRDITRNILAQAAHLEKKGQSFAQEQLEAQLAIYLPALADALAALPDITQVRRGELGVAFTYQDTAYVIWCFPPTDRVTLFLTQEKPQVLREETLTRYLAGPPDMLIVDLLSALPIPPLTLMLGLADYQAQRGAQ